MDDEEKAHLSCKLEKNVVDIMGISKNKWILEEIKPVMCLASRITKLRTAFFGLVVTREYLVEKIYGREKRRLQAERKIDNQLA